MKNLILSSSRLDEFMGCSRKFSYTYLQGFKPKYQNTTKLDRGSLFHKLAEVYYKAKMENLIPRDDASFASFVQKLVESGRALGITKYNLSDSDTELTVRTFRDYCSHYRYETFEIQGVEAPFSKELFSDEKLGLRVVINGTFDLLVKNESDQEQVVDHKTKEKDYMPGSLTNQFFCYAWASGRRYVLVNRPLLNLGVADDKRFKRQPYEYSPKLIEEWRTMVEYQARMIFHMVETGYFPPNYKHCETYGKCVFYDLCDRDPSIRLMSLEDNFTQSDEQYDDHRFEIKEGK